MTKVFGIGFHKTGTSSLGAALEVLGYRVRAPRCPW
ncbi:MAG: sulfotransferase [Acidobacteriota bacterium]|nr:sulfotransferase [Acidobacteriota bacterium]